MVKESGWGYVAAPRLRDGGTWLVMAARFGEEELWTCAIVDERGHRVATSVHARREAAVQAALDDALARGRPRRIVLEREAGPEHAEQIARFRDDVREYDRIARGDADPFVEEVAVFGRFLDAANLAVCALAIDRERELELTAHAPEPVPVQIRAGLTPTLMIAPASGGRLEVRFQPGDALPLDTVCSLRGAGWSHEVYPTLCVTTPEGRASAIGLAELRRVTAAIVNLIDQGLASIVWGGA